MAHPEVSLGEVQRKSLRAWGTSFESPSADGLEVLRLGLD